MITRLFDHTIKRLAIGGDAVGDDYRAILCSALTFDATVTTLAGLTYTEIPNANGYTTNGQLLANVAVTQHATSGGKFDADDLSWSASGGTIPATHLLLFNDTQTGDPPLLVVDFEGTRTAPDGQNFLVQWSANGIIRWLQPS